MTDMIIAFFILVFFAGLAVWGSRYEQKEWNSGVCPKCGTGKWRFLDIDSQGGVGFKCDKCINYTWQTYRKGRINDRRTT